MRKCMAIAAVTVFGLGSVPGAQAEMAMDWVTVGDPGNMWDGGYGSVWYTYDIGKYELTNVQYGEFLNAVDPDGQNQNDLYNSYMGAHQRGGGGCLDVKDPLRCCAEWLEECEPVGMALARLRGRVNRGRGCASLSMLRAGGRATVQAAAAWRAPAVVDSSSTSSFQACAVGAVRPTTPEGMTRLADEEPRSRSVARRRCRSRHAARPSLGTRCRSRTAGRRRSRSPCYRPCRDHRLRPCHRPAPSRSGCRPHHTP